MRTAELPARDTLSGVFYNVQQNSMSGLPASLSRSTGRGSGGSRGAGAGRVGASPRGQGRGTSMVASMGAASQSSRTCGATGASVAVNSSRPTTARSRVTRESPVHTRSYTLANMMRGDEGMQTTGPDQVLLLIQQLTAENEALRANLARQQDDTVRASLDTGGQSALAEQTARLSEARVSLRNPNSSKRR